MASPSTESEPRVPERRVDAERLLRELNDASGADLVLEGTAEHGESGGALYVRWPDGRPAVVTRTHTPVEDMRKTAEVLEVARAGGLPVPRHQLVVPIADAVVVVQERLPGMPAASVDATVIDRMVDAALGFRSLLRGRADVPRCPLHLRSSGPGFLRHETLAAYDGRSRTLLDRIRAIGRTAPAEAAGEDLVHPDYTFGNVLFDSGAVTGIVDWNGGVRRGDLWLSLVGLRFEMAWSTIYPDGQHDVEASAFARLDELLDHSLAPEVLDAYWAHWTLSRLDWTISNFPTADIDIFLTTGESRLLRT